jgi:hypothetical protein
MPTVTTNEQHRPQKVTGQVTEVRVSKLHLAQLARDEHDLRSLELGLRHPHLVLHGVDPDVRSLVHGYAQPGEGENLGQEPPEALGHGRTEGTPELPARPLPTRLRS